MSTNFPGARSHGTPQDTEMDVAWQELMAITELQVTLHQQNTESTVKIKVFIAKFNFMYLIPGIPVNVGYHNTSCCVIMGMHIVVVCFFLTNA